MDSKIISHSSISLPQNMAQTEQTYKPSRLHFFVRFAQTLLIKPITTPMLLALRSFKLLTWDASQALTLKALGYHTEASEKFEKSYLKTVRVARDILFIPTTAASAFGGMIASRKKVNDDLCRKLPSDYLSTNYTRKFDQFSSYLNGQKTFDVIKPSGIHEFAAESDGNLQTVMASHFLKPDVMAINFGIPNLATFVTEAKEDGSVQTVKVDAKSLKREEMHYHPTNGKIQSGIFFVPTNLPPEALERFKKAAKALEGRKDITCVNTNCRVLEMAGFSIDGKKMDKVIYPTTMMEHLLYRDVFYTGTDGIKHKVHFDIINTTNQSLEEHFTKIDTAVVGTRLRHRRRNADTEENRRARGAAAKAIIAEEKEHLANLSVAEKEQLDLTRRKVTVSVPSVLGKAISRIWGRHTIFEIDLADKKKEIAAAFEGQDKLSAFPHKKPSLATRAKRDVFFCKSMIKFIRRHMMGRVDELHLDVTDLFSHLKHTTHGQRLNYVILDDKIVLAKVKANGESKGGHRKAADWALSKHALLSSRQNVRSSGEIWYDQTTNTFKVNSDSGTYMPNQEQLNATVRLVNQIFANGQDANVFEAVAEEVAV